MATRLPMPLHAPLHARWRRQCAWLLVGLAWGIAILATLTGQRAFVDHHFLLEESSLPWPLAAIVFLIGWQVMITAMMAPSSIVRYAAVAPTRCDASYSLRTLAVFGLGYTSVWTAFGLLALSGDTLIHRLVGVWPWLAAHSVLIGATMLGLAGLYQFTSWKRICLAGCRTRHDSFMATARQRSTWWLGIQQGATSVGCCWALMLVMFGIGVGGLGWMFALTIVMLAETIVQGNVLGMRMRLVIGIVFLALAGMWLAHPEWLAPASFS
jgi:predicted metal-binding membrane protein